MGSSIQVPKQKMIELGDRLVYICNMLNAQKTYGTIIHGLDHEHGQPSVGAAEASFVSEWKTAIEKLLEAMNGTGELSRAIGNGAKEIDSKLAEGAGGAADKLSDVNLQA